MPRRQPPSTKRTVERVMHEYKHGELSSGRSAKRVKNPKQAIAIALSEAGVSKTKSPAQNRRAAKKAAAKTKSASKTPAKKKTRA